MSRGELSEAATSDSRRSAALDINPYAIERSSSRLTEEHGARRPIYDRELLLSGAKRNEVLELWEMQRYGIPGGALVAVRLVRLSVLHSEHAG